MLTKQNNNKVAIVFGATGQVGSYLCEHLLNLGYHKVIGPSRRVSVNTDERLVNCLRDNRFSKAFADITDSFSLQHLYNKFVTDKDFVYEVYNLAAASHVHTSFLEPHAYAHITGIGHLNILETSRYFHDLGYQVHTYFSSSSVLGDTPVLIKCNNNISLMKIEDVYKLDKDDEVECLTVSKNDYKTKWSKVAYTFTHKADNLYRIRGSGGLDINITGNHSVMVLDDNGLFIEKAVDKLNQNDMLISVKSDLLDNQKQLEIPLKQPKHPKRYKKIFGKIVINKDICRLIGYFLSEGSIKFTKNEKNDIQRLSGLTFCFHIKENYYTEDIKNIIKNNFGLQCKEFEQSQYNSRTIAFYHTQLAQFFYDNFKSGAWKKTIPSWFYKLDKKHFIELMRGYLGDAKITSKEICYTSVNYEMIHNLAYLCKLHGIDCTIIKRFNKARLSPQKTIIKDSWCYDLKITAKYAKEIVFDIEDYQNNHKCPNGELLPMNVLKQYITSGKNKKAISKRKLLDMVKNPNDKLKLLIDSDIHVVRIKSIEKIEGKFDVYDLNVPENQMFIGGNYPILLHNSETYGSKRDLNGFQSLATEMCPNSPYACAKLYAFHMNRVYREAYGMWNSSGIMFNTESDRRGDDFVTRKITRWFADFAASGFKLNVKLELGNINACRDWTDARDSVRAIHLINTALTPKDYIIASGETHSVKNFLEECYSVAQDLASLRCPYSLDEIYEINSDFFRPNEVPYLKGKAELLTNELGWKPKITFKELVRHMLESDYNKSIKNNKRECVCV